MLIVGEKDPLTMTSEERKQKVLASLRHHANPLVRFNHRSRLPIILSSKDKSIEQIWTDNVIIERDFGELENHPGEEYNEYQFWNYTLNRSDFGIEPIHDVFKRCEEFLDYIISKHPDGTILIVTHSSPYRALRHLIKKRPLKGPMLDGIISNCQYEEFEIN